MQWCVSVWRSWALELALGCCMLRSFLKYARRGLARLATMDAASVSEVWGYLPGV